MGRLAEGRKVEAEQLKRMGLEKNTERFTRIDPKTGKDVTTTPDGMSNGRTVEIKNLKEGATQYLTKQLRGQKEVSNSNGEKPLLRINKEARISKPLQEANFEIETYTAPPITPYYLPGNYRESDFNMDLNQDNYDRYRR